MKLDKRLKKTVTLLVNSSFDEQGVLNEKKVLTFAKSLRSLTKPKAITALSYYLSGIKRGISKTTLEIESPSSLSATSIKEIKTKIQKDFPVNQVNTKLNSSLFGGIRIKIGDVVFDDSVSRKIAQVKGVISG